MFIPSPPGLTLDWHLSCPQSRQSFVLDGMAAALGALFSTPLLGVTILLELGIVSRKVGVVWGGEGRGRER